MIFFSICIHAYLNKKQKNKTHVIPIRESDLNRLKYDKFTKEWPNFTTNSAWAQQIQQSSFSFWRQKAYLSLLQKCIQLQRHFWNCASTVHQSSTMPSRPLSSSLQASSSSWLAKICCSSSLSRRVIDTGILLGQSALPDRLSASWKIENANEWLLQSVSTATCILM